MSEDNISYKHGLSGRGKNWLFCYHGSVSSLFSPVSLPFHCCGGEEGLTHFLLILYSSSSHSFLHSFFLSLHLAEIGQWFASNAQYIKCFFPTSPTENAMLLSSWSLAWMLNVAQTKSLPQAWLLLVRAAQPIQQFLCASHPRTPH